IEINPFLFMLTMYLICEHMFSLLLCLPNHVVCYNVIHGGIISLILDYILCNNVLSISKSYSITSN
ncbi:PaaI family thioesterase, partial [Francisella tularensis subsp. holarctica]|nr:PaaI family thioesterase [Francisella tularensis subsp. holarctica]